MRIVRFLGLAALAIAGSGLSLSAQCGQANYGSSIGVGDDTVLPMQSLGFAFPFNGTTYTDIHPCTNGFVYLSNAGVPAPGGANCCAGTTATLVTGSPKICPMWTDHVVNAPGAVKFITLPGKAVVTWENTVEYGSATPQQQYTFQLQLLASGEIFFTYDSRCGITTAGDCLVGFSEGNGAAVPAASDLSVVGTSTTVTNFQLFNNTTLTWDLAGQAVQFVPTGTGYAWIPQGCAASTQSSYGTGCYLAPIGTFYELFATAAAFDLANSSLTMLRTPTGYTMVGGVSTYVAPSGTATALTLGDDTQTTVTLTSPFPYAGGTTNTLSVCSNGYISVNAAGNGTAWTPVAATMVAAPHTGFWCWHDMNPTIANSGQVKFEQIGSVAYVTYDGVFSFGTTNPETFQFQLDCSNGNVAIVWQTVGGFGNAFLVGYSGGGVSAGDPGSMDISAALPATFSVGGNDLVPLALAATQPAVGSTMVFTTSNIPEFAPGAGLYIAMNIISLGQVAAPGLDLGFIGAPGCPALVQSLDFTQAMVGLSSTQTVNFSLPPAAALGLQFFSQSAALITPNSLPNGQNAFGLTTSNGIASTTGQW